MKKFLVGVERANGNYSAYAPGLPGCVAAGHSIEEPLRLMHEAVEAHAAGLVEDGLPVPEGMATAGYVVLADTAQEGTR
jgi:predicted RNase H-like HicB family nuclease